MSNSTVLPLPESTYQLLPDAARTWPGADATQWIPDPSEHIRCLTRTDDELAGTVTRITNALTSVGVRRQDAVTLSGVNTSMLYAATLAAQAVGIAAPVNPALGGERLAELLRRTQSRVLVAAGPEVGEQLWQRLLAVARLVGAQPPAAQDLAAFVHTGGATGSPKVAAHTHANQLACGQAIVQSIGLTVGESILGGLPLFHVNALLVTGIGPMFGGQRVVWPSPAGYRDPALYARFWQIVEHYQIVAMSAVPTVYSALTRVPVDEDISSMRIPIVGASPLPASVREAFAQHTGRRLLEAYWLTEATCASTFTLPGEERIGSVGRAIPQQQVKAVRMDDDGSWVNCAPGKVGVLMINGPVVFAGYVTDPKLHGPITAIPATEVGKYHKPSLVADAAVRAVTDALSSKGLEARDIRVVHEHDRLVVTVAGIDPDWLADAVAGFALTVRATP